MLALLNQRRAGLAGRYLSHRGTEWVGKRLGPADDDNHRARDDSDRRCRRSYQEYAHSPVPGAAPTPRTASC